jgi:hypothetical protein
MELNDDNETELRSLLGKHPIGISSDALWTQSSTFEEKTDLSRALHVAKHQGWAYAKGGLYFLVNAASTEECVDTFVVPEVPKEDPWANTKKVLAAREVASAESKSELPVINANLKFGNLQRSVALGGAALVLYKFRAEHPLSLDDLAEILGVGKTSLYSAMTRLVLEGYAEKDDTVFRRPLFRWAGKYRYPFASMLATDNDMLKFKTFAEFEARNNPIISVKDPTPDLCAEAKVPVEFAIEPGKPIFPKNITSALQVIEAELVLHKQHIESLNRVKSALCES